MRSLMPQDMLRGDLDAHAGVGGHEVLHLVEALAGEIGDGFFALSAVIVAAIKSDHIQGAHRAQGTGIEGGAGSGCGAGPQLAGC